MSRHERTSQEIAAIAGRRLHDPDPEVRAMAASLLTQAADRPRAPVINVLPPVISVPTPLGVLKL